MTIIHLNLSYNNNNNTFRRSSRISNEILINAGVHVATENDDRQQTHNNLNHDPCYLSIADFDLLSHDEICITHQLTVFQE